MTAGRGGDRAAASLKARVPMTTAAVHMGAIAPGERVMTCPACGAPAAAAITHANDGYACAVCDATGDQITLVRASMRCGFADALITLSEIAATEERRRSGHLQDDLFGETR